MDHCNGFPTPTNVEAPLGIDANGSASNRYCPNSYSSVIGVMLYLALNTIPYISFDVNQCARFTHNTNASHETALNSIFRYLRGTKDNGMVFKPSKKLVLVCYAGAYFAVLWGN